MADIFNPEEDMILPDDFDPNAEFYDFEGNNNPQPEAEPTTEQPAAETTADSTEPQPTAEPTTEQPAAPVAPQTIKVKFNHEERELGLEEAALYAQKGMNYDKLDQRVKDYEARDARSNQLALNLGYKNTDEMIEAAHQNYVNRQVRELVEAGNTEAMARFLVEQKMKANSPAPQVAPVTAPVAVEAPSPQSEDPAKEERSRQIREFVQAYPGVSKLPDEVIKANVNDGIPLKTAYEMYQNKAALTKANSELEVLRQNQAAAAKAPVTGATGKASPSKEEADDPFMKGLDSAF